MTHRSQGDGQITIDRVRASRQIGPELLLETEFEIGIKRRRGTESRATAPARAPRATDLRTADPEISILPSPRRGRGAGGEGAARR